MFCASFNLCAILSLILFIFTLFSLLVPPDGGRTPASPVPTDIGLKESVGVVDIGALGLVGGGGGDLGISTGFSFFGDGGGGDGEAGS